MTEVPKPDPGFADRLITMLTHAGMRSEDLAARAGVPLETIEACLRGQLPDAIALYRIAKALDVTME